MASVSHPRRKLPVIAFVAFLSSTAQGLEKQGQAHAGQAGEATGDEFNASGAVTLGTSIYNPSYAARPDNTGLALFRYAGHADFDLIGQKLSLPLDINMFTDSQRQGLQVFLPTELDFIVGVTSTWPLGPGAIEVGSRYEHDMPVDQGGFTQSYIDVRARYIYSLASQWQALANKKTDVLGWATLGVFAWNPTYAARPDNTGLALFRYGLHTELSLFDDLLSFGIDAVMFTNRQSNPFRPSELDLTPEIILHKAPFELHIAYERDMPLFDGDFTQSYVYALAVWSWDLRQQATAPFESRGQILSP
jgi:hypothetical protein